MKIIKVEECSYCFYRDTFYTTPMARPIALCTCGDDKQILDMGEFKDGFPEQCPLEDAPTSGVHIIPDLQDDLEGRN